MWSYTYKDTEEIKKLLIDIEATKLVFNQISTTPEIEDDIRRQSLLHSAVYSARIEGNTLNIDQVKNINLHTKNDQKLEIFNILSTHRYVHHLPSSQTLTLDLIKEIHSRIMHHLNYLAGKFRQEPWAIFNSAGYVIYLAPTPLKIPQLMNEYVAYLSGLKFHPCIVSAFAQFVFEKIHPFADGNGRTGRLISVFLLQQSGYDFRHLLSLEEYIDKHREIYYDTLESETDITGFVKFFLQSILNSSQNILQKIHHSQTAPAKNSPGLPLRRQEILNIVQDHPFCSFNFISRRFPAINPKTLHYDLKQLINLGLLQKIGVSRGVTYKIVKLS